MNEYDRLRTVALSRPAPIGPCNDEVAHFLNFKRAINPDIFKKNHENVVECLLKHDVNVVFIDNYLEFGEKLVADQLPNRVYVRDLAAIIRGKLCLGAPSFEPRLPEFDIMHTALERCLREQGLRFDVARVPIDSQLEFGDFLPINDHTIVINCGIRNRTRDLGQLVDFFHDLGIDCVAATMLLNEHSVIHLDLACHTVGNKMIIGFDFLNFLPVYVYHKSKPRQILTFTEFFKIQGYEVILTAKNKSNQFLTNFINIAFDHILVNHRYKQELEDLLKGKGVNIESVDVDEIEVGSGSIHCITLPLERDN